MLIRDRVSVIVSIVLAGLLNVGCEAMYTDGEAPVQCPGMEAVLKVVNGTLQPTHVSLTPGQSLAIGRFDNCSGALIAPRWVLTADHCALRPGDQFCMGEDPAHVDVCISATRVVDHPAGLDMALVELVEDTRDWLAVDPIATLTETMTDDWLGSTVEAAGYGRTEGCTLGTRYFTAEPIVELTTDVLVIDGEGVRGACAGDSGGPVMAIANDGTVRIAGNLSGGSATCVGRDHYIRADHARAWIESQTGSSTEPP